MTWTLADPGLPPLPDGRKPTPPLTAKERARIRRASANWIAERYPRASKRGRAARERWAAVPDDVVFECRRELAAAVRRHSAGAPRGPLGIRGSLLRLAESASEVRDLLVEIEALGLRLEVER